MVQAQQHCSVYFCLMIIFKTWFFWLIWPFKCLILVILTIAKYHENLLKDSTLSLLFIVKFFSFLKTKMILKTPNETFLKITQYFSLNTEAKLKQIVFLVTTEIEIWTCSPALSTREKDSAKWPLICRGIVSQQTIPLRLIFLP